MKVGEAMHQGAEWRAVDTPLVEIAGIMAQSDVGAVPIGQNDRLVGMITDRDIVCRAVAKGLDCRELTARDVITESIVFCSEDEDLDEVISRMENRQIRRVPVINQDKRLVGILSLGDVAEAAPQHASQLAAAISAHHY